MKITAAGVAFSFSTAAPGSFRDLLQAFCGTSLLNAVRLAAQATKQWGWPRFPAPGVQGVASSNLAAPTNSYGFALLPFAGAALAGATCSRAPRLACWASTVSLYAT